jgi:hypothetical protein
LTSCPDPVREGPSWLRMLELKLPGAGDGASDDPRGANDIELFDVVRGALPGVADWAPSLSKLPRAVVLLYGTDACGL